MGPRGQYESSCNAQSCDYTITLQDFLDKCVWALPQPLHLAYALLGGRGTCIVAALHLNADKIWSESFYVAVYVLPFQSRHAQEERNREEGDYLLLASVAETPHLTSPGAAFHGEVLKPGYWVGFDGNCTGCVAATTLFTPETSANDVSWLTTFDFSCITQWMACTSEYDLLPKAWVRQTKLPRTDAEVQAAERSNLREVPAEVLGREALEAVEIEATEQAPSPTDGMTQVKVRVLSRLKHGNALTPGAIVEVLIMDNLLTGTLTYRDFRPDAKLIAIYTDPSGDFDAGLPAWQAYLSDTPENRAAFLAGAALDYSDHGPTRH